MLDLARWRAWLGNEADRLRAEGFETDFKVRDEYLWCTGLECAGRDRIGGFRAFGNCLVDYEVICAGTKRLLANEAMLAVDDGNFASVFAAFRKALDLEP
ncbi:MAG TPA: hypothetical protein VG889_21505 [Rhizomicrobium sp.]|nr:hypothetical protein [Rhizomicrobium sp.]